MKPILFSFFLLIGFTSPAQKIEKYFDYLWRACEPETARFYTFIEKTDSGWHRTDYFIHERKEQMDGFYEDSDCKIPTGLFYYFHANGVLESTGKYIHGKREGLWLSYHPNKLMSDSTIYANGSPVGNSLSWHENGYMSDSAVWNPDGSGVAVSWFDNGSVSSAGRYSAGKKPNGKWQFFHNNGKLSALETYKDGVMIDKQYFDESGNSLADTSNKDRPALFTGGQKGWLKYLYKKIYFPEQFRIANSDSAIVVVSFTIDENGTMTNVFVSTPFYPDFDKIAEDAVLRSPPWLPAIEHNRRVKYSARQGVSFEQ